MKNLRIISLALIFLCFGISEASAVQILYDWEINVDGTSSIAPDVYLPPTVGGEITEVSGFTMATIIDPNTGLDAYRHDVPEAIGTVAVTFSPGIGGDYNIGGYFDVEIDEWINTFFNESGATHGTADPTVNLF